MLCGFPGLLLFLILAALFRRRVRMVAPLRGRDRAYWVYQNASFYGGMATTFILTVGGLILLLSVNGTLPHDARGFFCIGNVAMLFAWGAAVGALGRKELRVIEISSRSITFAGVHPEFVYAVRRDQRGDLS